MFTFYKVKILNAWWWCWMIGPLLVYDSMVKLWANAKMLYYGEIVGHCQKGSLTIMYTGLHVVQVHFTLNGYKHWHQETSYHYPFFKPIKQKTMIVINMHACAFQYSHVPNSYPLSQKMETIKGSQTTSTVHNKLTTFTIIIHVIQRWQSKEGSPERNPWWSNSSYFSTFRGLYHDIILLRHN